MKKFLSVLIAVLTAVSCFAFTASAADKVKSVDLSGVKPTAWMTYHATSGDAKPEYKIGIRCDADDWDEIPVDKFLVFNNERVTCKNYIQLHTSNKEDHLNAEGKPIGFVEWSIEGTTANTFKVLAGLDADRGGQTNYTNVYIDGNLVYDGKDNHYTPTAAVEIEVTIPEGAKTLRLEAVTDGEFNSQFVVWNEPTLFNKDGSDFDPPFAPRTITVTEATKNHIKFSYTGAREGGNNWVGVYSAEAEITPDSHSEYSLFYVYLAPGDGEYDLDFEKCARVGEATDDYQPGTMMRNTNDVVLLGHLSEYKLIWLGGESWYETYLEVALEDEPVESSSAPVSEPAGSTNNTDDSQPESSAAPSGAVSENTIGEKDSNGWVMPVIIASAVVIVAAVVVIVIKKKK